MVRTGQFNFPLMQDIIPEGELGNARVEHFTISKEEAHLYSVRAIWNRDYMGRYVEAGDYCRLRVGEALMTSDCGGERWSALDIVREAHGKVLIAGLGIGMILCRILPKPEVEEVTVVEISQDIIDLVEKPLREYLGKDADKLEVVLQDIYEFKPEHKYNTIFFDIWGDYSGDTYEDTKKLHRKFQRCLDRSDSPWMESWMRWHMKELHFGDRY